MKTAILLTFLTALTISPLCLAGEKSAAELAALDQAAALVDGEVANRTIMQTVRYTQGWFGDITIKNRSKWDIKDIRLNCSLTGGSGTEVNSINRTIFEVVPALSERTFKQEFLADYNYKLPNVKVTIEGFDFVKFVPPVPLRPMSTNELAALKKKQAAAKLEADAKVLAFQKEQAAAGSAHYQYVLGLRYASGDGVSVDVPKARELLAASAAQGNSDASTALKKLSKTAPLMTHSP